MYNPHLKSTEELMQRNNLFSEKKTDDISKQRAEKFIHWLNEAGLKGFNVSKDSINEFFAKEFIYEVNDQTGPHNADELMDRFMNAHKVYQKAFIHFPLLELQVKDNQLTAKYKATFIDKNNQAQETSNSIQATFDEQGKVKALFQAFNPPLKVNDLQEPKVKLSR